MISVSSESPIDMPRTHDSFKYCLGFIVTKQKRNKKLIEDYDGTAFFVSVPLERYPALIQLYLVTSRHVVFDKQGDARSNLYLRLNTNDGKRDDIALRDKW